MTLPAHAKTFLQRSLLLLFLLPIVHCPAAVAGEKKSAAAAAAAKVAGVRSEPLPPLQSGADGSTTVRGVLFGKPFVAEEALINSISLTLRQRHKIYNRVVINFAGMQRKLSDYEIMSEGKGNDPRVELAQKVSNGAALSTRSLAASGSDCALKVKFAPRRQQGPRHGPKSIDTTAGAIVVRFKDGDYLTGTFNARQSPRLLWDDEMVQ